MALHCITNNWAARLSASYTSEEMITMTPKMYYNTKMFNNDMKAAMT